MSLMCHDLDFQELIVHRVLRSVELCPCLCFLGWDLMERIARSRKFWGLNVLEQKTEG